MLWLWDDTMWVCLMGGYRPYLCVTRLTGVLMLLLWAGQAMWNTQNFCATAADQAAPACLPIACGDKLSPTKHCDNNATIMRRVRGLMLCYVLRPSCECSARCT
jgi:hypothetical protein